MPRCHLLKLLNSVASKHHVWLTFCETWHKVMSFIVIFTTQCVLLWFSSIPESFIPLVEDGHTAWIHCFWISNQFHRLCRWFPTAAAQRHPLTPSLFDILVKVKTFARLDVRKPQSSNFTEMTSGRYDSISSFRGVFTLSQTTLVKLIAFVNFWLAATSPTCVAKVTYILVLAKNMLLLARGY